MLLTSIARSRAEWPSSSPAKHTGRSRADRPQAMLGPRPGTSGTGAEHHGQPRLEEAT
jgi:hypothetical protein